MSELLAKLARFVVVGVGSGAIYAAVTTALVAAGIAPVPASIAGYCASVPLSFIGHRQFTFRANGRWTAEALRFVFAQAVNISVTAGSMRAAVEWLGDWRWGMVAAVVLVPVANFVFMNLWVFRQQRGRQGA